MYFWHWARCTSAKSGEVAKMTHGQELHERWDGVGQPPVRHSPPFVGAPALEITHPFHFKLSPSMLLGPTCNHDLNCFLRLPNLPAQVASPDEVITAMLDAMGDNEYYCASYASKTEPQLEGFLPLLTSNFGLVRLCFVSFLLVCFMLVSFLLVCFLIVCFLLVCFLLVCSLLVLF